MEGIVLETRFSTQVNREEARQVLGSALRHQADLANARRAHFERACQAFEQRHHITLIFPPSLTTATVVAVRSIRLPQ